MKNFDKKIVIAEGWRGVFKNKYSSFLKRSTLTVERNSFVEPLDVKSCADMGVGTAQGVSKIAGSGECSLKIIK